MREALGTPGTLPDRRSCSVAENAAEILVAEPVGNSTAKQHSRNISACTKARLVRIGARAALLGVGLDSYCRNACRPKSQRQRHATNTAFQIRYEALAAVRSGRSVSFDVLAGAGHRLAGASNGPADRIFFDGIAIEVLCAGMGLV